MQSFKNPNQTCSIITSRQFLTTLPSLTSDSTSTTRRRMCYRIIIKGHLANTHGGQMTGSGQIYENYSSEREIKSRRVKVIEVKGYNSKIVSADKA